MSSPNTQPPTLDEMERADGFIHPSCWGASPDYYLRRNDASGGDFVPAFVSPLLVGDVLHEDALEVHADFGRFFVYGPMLERSRALGILHDANEACARIRAAVLAQDNAAPAGAPDA